MKPLRALDLFCGAGGASAGLASAGFAVHGIDLKFSRLYPFPFVREMDALKVGVGFLRSFDFIWASPPCQHNTALKVMPNAKRHDDLIPETRDMLIASGVPYCIENVVGAALRDPVMLCGSHFGLGVDGYQLRRHRLFEASFPIPQPKCAHTSPVIGVYGGHVRCRAAKSGGRGTRDFVDQEKAALAAACMEIDWMTMTEISQAIPPAYSRHIAHAAILHIAQHGRIAA